MDSFANRQHQIYQSFRDQMNSQPLVSDGSLNTGSGCLLVLRYGPDVTRPLEDVSRRIASHLPALVYHADNLHTTIATGSALPLRARAHEDELTLFNRYRQFLSTRVTRMAEHWLGDIRIQPQELLFNRNSVILATEPCEAFIELAKAIQVAANEEELPMQMPWGSHITVSRFLPEQHDLSILPDLLQPPRLPEFLQPVGLQLVWFECSAKHFRFIEEP